MSQSDFGRFHSTHWSAISAACEAEAAERREALDRLVQRYWPALFAHLMLRRGLAEHRAEDVLQGFILERFLEQEFLRRADRKKGKFRSFLLRSLENYLIDIQRREAKDAAGHGRSLSSDDSSPDGAMSELPDVFHVVWARQTLTEALDRMKADCMASGHGDRWGLFKRRVLLPILAGAPPEDYVQLVERYHFRSPQQASNALITAKRQFERTLAAIIAEYSDGGCEVAEEIDELRQILAKAGPLGITVEDSDWLGGSPRAAPRSRQLPKRPTADDSQRVHSDEFPIDLSENQALRLIRACEQTTRDTQWTDDELSAMWQHLLTTPLREVFTTSQTDEVERLACLHDILSCQHPDLRQLHELKSYARYSIGGDRLPTEIAWALYFVAIAAALVHGGQFITKLSHEVLVREWTRLHSHTMISAELRHMLKKAVEHLQRDL